MKQHIDERSFRDPVCDMEVSRLTAFEEYLYQDKVYYFCSQTCREKFKAEPATYIHHHRQHGMKQQ